RPGRAGRRRVRGRRPQPAPRARRRGRRPPPRRRAPRARDLRGHAGAVRDRRRARPPQHRAGGVARHRRAPRGPRGAAHGVEHRRARPGHAPVRRPGGRALLLRALLRRAALGDARAAGRGRDAAAPGAPGADLGRARLPVPRRRRERPAQRHPVPPREVRRRGRPPAGELGRRPPV
ncbi:MAG: Imidazole glycerol phosphate synthase amidotransferase subunit, partial [uncultured Quadrisphaera sp.]